MPEGPELRNSRNILREHLLNKQIVDVEVASTSRYGKQDLEGLADFQKLLKNTVVTIKNIDVKGKFQYWTLEYATEWLQEPFWLHCTYGMSGQWVVDKQVKHPVVTFTLSNGQKVTFNDPRHFGTLKYVYDPIAHENKLASIGPDMFDLYSKVGGSGDFASRLRCHPNRTLAEVLMNQSVVSGIGNYIKAEALYASKLSPHRLISTLSDEELNELFYATVTVMIDSYNSGGATIRTYKNPDGAPGEYTFTLKVYGKATDPNGNPVTREETRDGRTTHWCPSIQK